MTHNDPNEILLSRHGADRAAQRGADLEAIWLLLAHGDIEVPVGGKRRALRLSWTKAAELKAEGQPAQTVEQTLRLELILANNDAVITIIRCDPGQRRRRSFRRWL